MKELPIIIALLVVVIAIRLRMFYRRRSSTNFSLRPVRMGDRRLLGDTGLVAGREIRERLRGRVFRVVTVILFAAVAAAVVVPTFNKGTVQTGTVGVVAGSASLNAVLQNLAGNVGINVRLVSESSLSQAQSDLKAGRVEMVVDGNERILIQKPISATDTSAGARYVRDVSLSLGAQRAYLQAGLTSEQVSVITNAKPLPIQSIEPAKTAPTTSETTALLGVILIFIVLTQYLTWTLMGVMEEKASRVVEVLLATVRPIQLLAGKVLGIGAIALAQSTGLVVFALVLGELVGSSFLRGNAPLVAAATLVWLVLGYAFYSWVYAAAGSLAERQDQVQSLALPLSVPLILGYIVSLIGVSTGSASLLVKILAYIPPTAPFAMPTLVGFGEATWWQFLLSVALSLVCTVIVALYAARIYRRAVLQTGGRVRLRDIIPESNR